MAVNDPDAPAGPEESLWRLLGHRTTSKERRAAIARFLSSPELHAARDAWRDPAATRHDPGDRPSERPSPASDERFVRLAYECLLGRDADLGGLAHYRGVLASGGTRLDVVRSLLVSDELAQRAGRILVDTQLCELANPAKWDNGEWLDTLRSLGLADDKHSMHRKAYEFTQLVYGCRRLGALHENAAIVSVGAGHELVLYWLANHARMVVATDMYEGVWRDVQGREGDPTVLTRPEDYAPFEYRRDHLAFLKMDGRRLGFRDGMFDLAYSLSSIEHFGGLAGAVATIQEMARVVKPGGVVAVATEYVLAGPPHEETFQPREIDMLFDQPGLSLVEPIDTGVFRRYVCTPVDLYQNPYESPHMVVRFNDTVFTTVMAFLRKR